MTFLLTQLQPGAWVKPGLLMSMILITGCSTPAQRLDRTAATYGYSVQALKSTEFQHRIYRNLLKIEGTADTLHVYLEGDGTPWVGNHRIIAADPTPRSPLMLELMALDNQPAIYIGRPCYNGYSANPACNPSLWTDARYSERVVDSMAQVLQKRVRNEGAKNLVLFGHSGGGVLAVLLAKRLSQARAVVTMSANLDIDAWADLHGYSRLHRSLNPAVEPALDSTILQLHLVGGKDRNVRPTLLHSYQSRQPNSQAIVIPGYDHVCCWEDLWPKVLQWVAMDGAVRADQWLARFLNH
jgi:pimeloyl-ACP methyl ester carboxylesterase